MKFLIDMNLSPLWVSFLGDQGLEAVHWSTVGLPGAADPEIFDFAATNGCVIQVRCQDVLPSAIGDLVLRAVRASEPHLDAGALVTVDAFRHRIRLLPI
jgi:predicted nuclease of predicted toxin-antitoxin system